MIAIDHIGIRARDAEGAARFLSEMLGLGPPEPAGPDGDIFRLHLAGSPEVLFFPAEEVLGQHLAFRVDGATFDSLVDRLRAGGLPFGNHPEAQGNGQTSDIAGGLGRVFFRDPDGHLYEVIA